MPILPFRRSDESESLTIDEIRDRLIEAAASGSTATLQSVCQQYKEQVADNVNFMCKPPAKIISDNDKLNQYVQCLGAVAQCLAHECGSPGLWNQLTGTEKTNPLAQWEEWYAEFPRRMDQLEHDTLIAEVREFIDSAQSLQGETARQNEALLTGRLGELLFHSGRASESIELFQAALSLCDEIHDINGACAYLSNLMEVYQYLDNTSDALDIGEKLQRLLDHNGQETESLKKRLQRMRKGEPLCRIVCVCDGEELELDELSKVSSGKIQFQFHRNRLALQKTSALVQQGNVLASSGQLAEALDTFQQAIEVDPHDPDPVYQSGVCLLELGMYSRARAAFEEVERLAPGWFRCRSDQWLAQNLETGDVSDEEFHLLRLLEDGGLSPEEALKVGQKAITTYPEFAPLYLILGDLHRSQDKDKATKYYRKGLELVAEPDLESRLLCALAGSLPSGSQERKKLIEQASSLKGSLVAHATTKLLELMESN